LYGKFGLWVGCTRGGTASASVNNTQSVWFIHSMEHIIHSMEQIIHSMEQRGYIVCSKYT
jgi:hypothetical protein